MVTADVHNIAAWSGKFGLHSRDVRNKK